ncbi:Bloom syndrome protein -like protein, partial [Caligus rogercresseyi]
MPTGAERVSAIRYQPRSRAESTVVLSLLASLIYDKFTKLDGLESCRSHRGQLWPAAENIRKGLSPHAPNHTPLRDSRE